MKIWKAGEDRCDGLPLTFALPQLWYDPLRPGLFAGAGFDLSLWVILR